MGVFDGSNEAPERTDNNAKKIAEKIKKPPKLTIF